MNSLSKFTEAFLASTSPLFAALIALICPATESRYRDCPLPVSCTASSPIRLTIPPFAFQAAEDLFMDILPMAAQRSAPR